MSAHNISDWSPKLIVGSRQILKKYRVQANSIVSWRKEDFHCDGAVRYMTLWNNSNKKKKRSNRAFGPGKKEYKISDVSTINDYIRYVNGNE